MDDAAVVEASQATSDVQELHVENVGQRKPMVVKLDTRQL